MNSYVFVAIGGALGAILRFGVSEMLENEPFPQATLLVNLVGSILIGICAVAMTNSSLGPEGALFLMTGVLGAFTTMSAFSLETIEMIEQKLWGKVLPYDAVTVICCPLMAFLGIKVGHFVFPS